MAGLTIVEIKCLRDLHGSIVLLKVTNFDFRLLKLSVFSFVFHRVIAFADWVARNNNLLLVHLRFFYMLLRVKLHFILIVVTGLRDDKATF